MKFFLVAILLTILPQLSIAGSFTKTTKLTKIMAYAQDTGHSSNECVLYFDSDAKSSCADKQRAVIASDTEIGKLMCSMALAAFMGGKSVDIASHDDCSPIHNAPFVRYVRIVN